MKKNEILLDRRVVERNLREGVLAPADLEKFFRSLPDLSACAQWVSCEDLAPRPYLKAIGIDRYLAAQDQAEAE